MTTRRSILLAALALASITASAQTYPSKPIKFVVAFGAGTVTDAAARLVGERIARVTGQPVVVDNRPGANGILGASAVASSAPDGYTVLVSTQTTHAANPSLFKKLPYDPVNGFIPVSPVSRGALVLVARPDFPANNIAELTSLAKQSPGKYTFANTSSTARAGGELYRMLAKVDLRDIPYKSAPQAITDMMGGHVDLLWADGFTAMSQVRAGKLKALATTGSTRLQIASSIPTMAEQGVAGYELYGWTGIWLPAKSPPEVVSRLAELVQAAVEEGRDTFANQGLEALRLTPQEFTRFQAAELKKWAIIVKAAGIEPE